MSFTNANVSRHRKDQRFSNYILWFLAILAFISIWSCNPQAVGFSLPPGDLEDGKVAFTNLACNQCHSVEDIGWAGEEGTDLHLQLGGQVVRLKTYGDLVTSIINPSHKISNQYKGEMPKGAKQSPMPSYNQVLTVQELIDLVTFLQETYELRPPPGNYTMW
ncbi:MAG: c-type cytochrome [Saprospiraceae bacterium]|nr:c-type cytochrome [Saprospiraceae bacterium]